ncbi:hypothetical protein ACNAN0_11895 [Agrilactobacillus fermenti]|uniref:hypothetical protein n=1 Tax=Agrilactobacillus fermenti TaxID=2586909 RepID=UPI003A5BCD3E
MWQLFKFEQKRLFQQPRIWILSGIFVIACLIIGFGFKQTNDGERVDTNYQLQNTLNLIQGSQNQSHSQLQQDLSQRYRAITQAKQSDRQLLKYQQQDLQRYFTTGSYVTDVGGNELLPQQSLDQYVLHRQQLVNYLVKQKMAYHSVRYGANSVMLLISMLPILTSVLGIIVLLLIFALPQLQALTTEKLGWLDTLPIQRRASFNAQLLVFASNTLGFIMILSIVLYLYGGILGGFTTLNYPILTYWAGTTQLKPAIQVIGLSLLLFWINLLLVYLLLRLVIALIKPIRQRLSLAFVVCGLMLGGLLILAQTPNIVSRTMGAFLPSSYLQSSQVLFANSYQAQSWLNGNTVFFTLGATNFFSIPYENVNYFLNQTVARLQQNPHITIELGLVVNTIAAGLSYLAANKLYRQRLN